MALGDRDDGDLADFGYIALLYFDLDDFAGEHDAPCHRGGRRELGQDVELGRASDDDPARDHEVFADAEVAAEPVHEVGGRARGGGDVEHALERLAGLGEALDAHIEHGRDLAQTPRDAVGFARHEHARGDDGRAVLAARDLHLGYALVHGLALLDDHCRDPVVGRRHRELVEHREQRALAVRHRVPHLVLADHARPDRGGARVREDRRADRRQKVVHGRPAARRVGPLGLVVAVISPFGAVVDVPTRDRVARDADVAPLVKYDRVRTKIADVDARRGGHGRGKRSAQGPEDLEEMRQVSGIHGSR